MTEDGILEVVLFYGMICMIILYTYLHVRDEE